MLYRLIHTHLYKKANVSHKCTHALGRYVEVTFPPRQLFLSSLTLLQIHRFLLFRLKVCCLSEASSPSGENHVDVLLQHSAYGSLNVLILRSLTPQIL